MNRAVRSLLFVSLFVSAPVLTIAQPAVVNEASLEVVRDLAYKPDGTTSYERERCKLDLYLPKGRQGFATIVWFHGGGLRNGDKAGDIAISFAERFSAAGIAVASVNYRLSPQAKSPAYVEDAAAAVAYVQEQIGRHGGSGELVFVSGHSAGGYLTSMVGMDPRYLQRHGLETDTIAGYMPISGQMITHSTVRAERGIDRSQPIIDSAAPAYHVRADAAPFLCIAGDEDLPARAEENRYFVAALKAAGHPSVSYHEFPGRNHATIANRINEQGDEVAEAIEQFMEEVGAARK
jgi:acetyl esterase/lipase